MADAVDTKVIQSDGKYHIARWTNLSDGTGEAAVIKLDVSTLLNANKRTATRTRLRKISWRVQGFPRVTLLWDATTDDEIMVLAAGTGELDFDAMGIPGLLDPQSSGYTGDVLLTAPATFTTGSYDIVTVWELI